MFKRAQKDDPFDDLIKEKKYAALMQSEDVIKLDSEINKLIEFQRMKEAPKKPKKKKRKNQKLNREDSQMNNSFESMNSHFTMYTDKSGGQDQSKRRQSERNLNLRNTNQNSEP